MKDENKNARMMFRCPEEANRSMTGTWYKDKGDWKRSKCG